MTLPARRAALALCLTFALFTSSRSFAYTGQDPIFRKTFFDSCGVERVRARLGADGASMRYWIEGSCPGGRVSGQIAYRNGVFNEVFDLGGPGVLKSKGNCTDNPWVKAARCENVLVQGEGPGISSLLAQHPYSPGGEISAPFSLMVPGAETAFRRAHDNPERPNPPIAPVGFKATRDLGGSTAKLSWLAPDESGDRPFLNFLAQARPQGMEGAAWVELGKFDRKPVAAYTASVRLPPPIGGTEGWDVRLCSATALTMTCSAAIPPTYAVGKSVLAAPKLNEVSPTVPTVSSVGRMAGTPRVEVKQSICERAADAQARNSPAAAALVAKCRAEGGEPGASAAAPDLDALAVQGAALAAEDALASKLRASLPDADTQRGFDIAMAVARDQTEWGPGKQKLHDSLSAAGQAGFKTATSYLFDRNRYAERARLGASMAAADAALEAERSADDDARFQLGFDIATAIFGDPAQGAQGNKSAGPGSLGIRDSLSAPAQRGFNAAMSLHLAKAY